MARKRENGYGTIVKLSGKRRKPYAVFKSEMVIVGKVVPPAYKNTLETAIANVEQAYTAEDIYKLTIDALFELDKMVDADIEDSRKFALQLLQQIKKDTTLKQVQKRKRIGSYASYKEAEMALAEYNMSPEEKAQRKVTFKELFPLMYAERRVDETSVSNINKFNQGFDKCEAIHDRYIDELRTEDLEAVLKEYEGMSESTQKKPLDVIRYIFQYADKHDLIEKDYSAYIKIGKTSKTEAKNPYTREEVQTVWDNIDWVYTSRKLSSPWIGLEIPKLILVLIYTGMRINELLLMKKENVHIGEEDKGGYFEIVKAKTKAGQRLVPIHPAIRPIVQYFYNKNKVFLIENKKGKINDRKLDGSPMEAFYKEVGFEHTFHETRHTFATFTLTPFNRDLRAYIIGHTTNNLTNDVYTHPEILLPELLEEIKKLEITKKDGR